MTDLPTGTITFLFTDIEGSTRLLTALGVDTYSHCLADHDALIRHAIAEHDGVEVRTEGDSFFVVFTDATSAVKAAADSQRALAGHDWPSNGAIKVRMGLHTGEGRLGGDNYVGIDVHRAARISDAANGGQVLVSDATVGAARGTLSEGLEFEDLGKVNLKDFSAVMLNQLNVEGLPHEFPPLRGLQAAMQGLPTQMTSFIGREREMKEIIGFLDDRRLLTLTGPGGTGKTRLSLQVASEVLPHFSDGVWFVPLDGIADPQLIPTTILSVLGLRTNSTELKPIDHLASFLATRSVLLVLDNFEQLVDGSAVVSDLLAAGPDVKVVVTSRVPLRISGEQEVPVSPLSTTTVKGGQTSEGSHLFIDRAKSVKPDFEVSEESAAAIAKLAERLDGLPLAIELAASRVKVLSPAAILDRLDNQLLASPDSDLPSRQQTIVNTIAWSYDLLDESSRRLFEDFSVFAGPALLEQIENVCQTGDASALLILDAVATLVDHSLIRTVETAGETRFAMLRVVREYAHAALVVRGSDAEVQSRHALAYTALVAAAQPHLRSSGRGTWLARIAADHDNIRAAMDWALESEDAETALAIVGGMWLYWQTRGPLPEASDRIRRALLLDGGGSITRASALEAAGGIAYWDGDSEGTIAPYAEAVHLLKAKGDSPELARALYNKAFAHIGQEDWGKAKKAIARSRSISENLGDLHGIGMAQWAMYNVAHFSNNIDEALEHAQASVKTLQQVDARFDLGWAYFTTGHILMEKRDLKGARQNLDNAMPGFLEDGDLSALILFFTTYAGIESLSGRQRRAARLFGAAQGVKERTGITMIDSVQVAEATQQIRELLREDAELEEAEFEAGRRMTPEEAVAYAMDPAEEAG
jgi:predicted ATPase/class 3 adenylate cyclase